MAFGAARSVLTVVTPVTSAFSIVGTRERDTPMRIASWRELIPKIAGMLSSSRRVVQLAQLLGA